MTLILFPFFFSYSETRIRDQRLELVQKDESRVSLALWGVCVKRRKVRATNNNSVT